MSNVLWLSKEDIRKTGVCDIADAAAIVDETFRLYHEDRAIVAQEVPLRLSSNGSDRACYSLPAYVGGNFNVCGIKWTAHGGPVPADSRESRIKACVVLNDPDTGDPIAVMNSTEIGAARTGAVTALALKQLAPEKVSKLALCGAGGQAEWQLQAALLAFPDIKEIAVWSRGYQRAVTLVNRYEKESKTSFLPTPSVDEAVKDADVIIGATSAPEPYLTPDRLQSASLYCHIGFHELCADSIQLFRYFVFDSWEAGKQSSGQSIFRMYREGLFRESKVTGLLGAILSGQLSVPRGTPEAKVMFDAFGLQIFDVALAKEAYNRAKRKNLGELLEW
ncbi:MAG: ornithine cyclodeaminase family protein [Oscillospiraceae bacterium]|nr:ornithine cyclodeaminase family protein [Oscillospiraceae bacterium]